MKKSYLYSVKPCSGHLLPAGMPSVSPKVVVWMPVLPKMPLQIRMIEKMSSTSRPVTISPLVYELMSSLPVILCFISMAKKAMFMQTNIQSKPTKSSLRA